MNFYFFRICRNVQSICSRTELDSVQNLGVFFLGSRAAHGPKTRPITVSTNCLQRRRSFFKSENHIRFPPIFFFFSFFFAFQSITKMNPENLLLRLRDTNQKCSVGCPVIDRCLGGGIPCNSLTEIVGESGCGKTQICLQLVLSAQLPPSHGGLSASSLYIHTEFPFPIRRLKQLSNSFRSLHSQLFSSENGNRYDLCDCVFVERVYSANELLATMSKIEWMLKNSRTPIKLIVIDSIAALFRSDFDNTPLELKRRSSLFFKISGELKSLANRFGLAVVVTNQVGDLIGVNEGLNLPSLYSMGRRVCPALGLAWANCVNSRLFLSRDEEIVAAEIGYVSEDAHVYHRSKTRRRISVVFAPHLPNSSCEYVIKREGVFGVETDQSR